MASGDHYLLIDRQSLLGQEVLNVYCYLCTGDGVTAAAVGALFESAIIANMVSQQSSQLSHNVLEVSCFEDLADFANLFVITPGVIGGDCLPPYDAVSLFYARTTRASHNGYKRIAGVPESLQVNGALTSGAFTAFSGLATLLFGPIISVDPAISMVPQIWRRPRLSPPRLQAFFGVSSIVASPDITTQNTRKFGRGV